jgi:hypothetical protein
MTCLSGASEAFTLQRIAATIDLTGVAAAHRIPALDVPGAIARLTLPDVIELSAPCTEIQIGVPVECTLTIEIADESGAPLCLAEAHMPAGWQKVGFSGRDASGNPLPNGVYFYTVTADGYSRTTQVRISR